jgi:hypothetical protein
MRSMIRSLFLLSLSAAPLALAATPEKAITPSTAEMSSSATDSAPAEVDSRDLAQVRVQVSDLESALKGLRRELGQLREQEDARARVIGDPNDHPNWP